MKSGQEILALCDRVRQTAFELQCPLQVCDENGTVLGDYFADLFVELDLILELKACKALTNDQIAQVLGYRRASGKRHALLINFGAAKLEIRKLIL